MRTRPNDVERAIQTRLIGLSQTWRRTSRSYSDAYCTRQIKRSIGAEGRERGFTVYTAAPGFRRFGEWIFDLTWLKELGGEVLDIPLALECEWMSGNETFWDFQKLLVSRAKQRILVMYARNAVLADRSLKTLIRQVRRFKQTRRGDRYMFACYLRNTDEFLFKIHVA